MLRKEKIYLKHIDTFEYSDVQQNMAWAIYYRRFGNPTILEAVSFELAKHIDTFKYPETQKTIFF